MKGVTSVWSVALVIRSATTSGSGTCVDERGPAPGVADHAESLLLLAAIRKEPLKPLQRKYYE
ncbi:hypothetical protein GCM10017668_47810 [Streptomyces tuirus]|uniref:Uncharacterized protein n=1 Tax=Streptomyces tuirus TaxID=68278 RepID=A0A7G1NIF0_9ACTN|nr:hypothetical protein GCM10017668_47810 [Streptomyces tuirus]